MQEINEKLDKIMNLLLIINKESIKEYILNIITEDDELLLYEESDGIKSTRKLEEITGISKSKISTCWEKWTKLGLMMKNKENRGIRLFDLDIICLNT